MNTYASIVARIVCVRVHLSSYRRLARLRWKFSTCVEIITSRGSICNVVCVCVCECERCVCSSLAMH